MGTIVWSAATAHTGAMMRLPGGDGEDRQRADRVFAAFDMLATSLKSARPDVVVMVANDHFQTFDYAGIPIFAIGTGDSFEGWGEFGVPKRNYNGLAQFGATIHAELVAAGFDALSARDMKLDHSFSCPLQLLLKEWDVPVLPVFVNCTVPPLPTLPRCMQFGAALGEAIRRQPDVERVAIIGTGGLSHWVGMPQTGTINRDFDRRFLEQFVAGRFADIAQWDSAEILESAGNAAGEIRNWLTAAAAARATGARVLAYEPVESWVTGIAVTELVS